MAAKGPADDLLAQQLRAERPDAEDMRHRIGVPPLRQHRDRNDATDRFAKTSDFTDRVHHLAEKVLVGDGLGRRRIAGPLNQFAAEALDLILCEGAEFGIEGVAGLQLLAVDEQRSRLRKAVPVIVVIAKELEVARERRRRDAVLIFIPIKAGNEIIDEFRCGGIVRDNNEHWRNIDRLVAVP